MTVEGPIGGGLRRARISALSGQGRRRGRLGADPLVCLRASCRPGWWIVAAAACSRAGSCRDLSSLSNWTSSGGGTQPGISLDGCQAGGLSRVPGCALNRPSLRQRSWSAVALTPVRSWAATLSGPPAPGRWTGARCSAFRSLRSSTRPLDQLLSARFATFRTIYLPTVAQLRERGFALLPTGRRPHFTVRLQRADDPELGELLAALGPPQANPQYAKSATWRED